MTEAKDRLGDVTRKHVCLMSSGEHLARNVLANDMTTASQKGPDEAKRRDNHQNNM